MNNSADNRISIMFVIDGLYSGGKERQLVEILKGLDKKKFRLGIITFHRELFYTNTAKHLSEYFVELDKDKNKFKPFFTIWKSIKEFNPDIIHTWDYLSSLYVFLPTKFKSIKFVNGSIRDSGIERGWQYMAKKLMLKFADLVVANSLQGLKAYKIKGEVIYNAIDKKRFSTDNKVAGYSMIMVASFSNYKNHQMFIDAAHELLKSGIIDDVYLAGDGELKRNYVDQVATFDESISSKFYFLGTISKVEEILKKCSIGVLCSTVEYSEGVSNSILEYMAAGLVPIATNIGATSEIIENGLNGFLVSPGSAAEIVEKVKLVKQDKVLFSNIILNARQTIDQKFNYEKNIYQLILLYKKLINK
jgi:glycosyltransferase involved in cell wall biosynthesis